MYVGEYWGCSLTPLCCTNSEIKKMREVRVEFRHRVWREFEAESVIGLISTWSISHAGIHQELWKIFIPNYI